MKLIKREWWKKCKEIISSISLMRMKKGEQEKESRRSARRPIARQTLEILESGSFSLRWDRVVLSVSDVVEKRSQIRTELVIGMEDNSKKVEAAERGRQN